MLKRERSVQLSREWIDRSQDSSLSHSRFFTLKNIFYVGFFQRGALVMTPTKILSSTVCYLSFLKDIRLTMVRNNKFRYTASPALSEIILKAGMTTLLKGGVHVHVDKLFLADFLSLSSQSRAVEENVEECEAL
jgi:hypothetical protein